MRTLWRSLRDTFELSRGGAAGNMGSMEGMRGLAVTGVFFVHYATLSFPYAAKTELSSTLQSLHMMGNVGVDLFFVLSGYLIYAATLKRPNYSEFMWRRIRRIYPTFLAVLLVYLLLSLADPHASKIPSGVLRAIIYVAENVLLLPGIFPIKGIISVAWSLSYEMLYYLFIPLLVMGGGLHHWPRKQRIALFLLLAVAGALVSSVAGGPVRAIMFFGGVLLYEMKNAPVRLPFVAPVALIAACCSMLLPAGTHALDAMHAALLFVTLPLFCFACFAHPSSISTRWLSAWPIRWLGNMSYSYYLLHGLVLKMAFMEIMRMHGPTGHQATLAVELLAPLYLLTIAASAVLFVVIERPLSLRESRPRMAVGIG
jgi:peptidoglycan/LPS O-acetylase OafA/YrhL